MNKLLFVGLSFTVCSLSAMSPQDKLFKAVEKREIQTARKLIESGNVDVNQARNGWTLLRIAKLLVNISMMRLLLEKGAQVDRICFMML